MYAKFTRLKSRLFPKISWVGAIFSVGGFVIVAKLLYFPEYLILSFIGTLLVTAILFIFFIIIPKRVAVAWRAHQFASISMSNNFEDKLFEKSELYKYEDLKKILSQKEISRLEVIYVAGNEKI